MFLRRSAKSGAVVRNWDCYDFVVQLVLGMGLFAVDPILLKTPASGLPYCVMGLSAGNDHLFLGERGLLHLRRGRGAHFVFPSLPTGCGDDQAEQCGTESCWARE